MNKNLIDQNIKLPCGAILKNRIAKAAMSENMATRDHRANEKFATLYNRWARSGAALLITGNVMVDKFALGEPANVVVELGQAEEELKAWSKAGIENHTHLWLQVNHPGKQSPKFLSAETVAPSSIPLRKPLDKMFATPRALTEAEIHSIIRKFAYVAGTAQRTGFTGIQIHGAHGYLISQFLSSHHNQRTDSWGGSLENRMRFVLSIYDSIRAEVGPQFPVSIKLNSADFQKGGFSREESMEVVLALAERGVDLIEISGGSYEAPEMMGRKKATSTSDREAYFLDYCLDVRKKIRTPLMLTGGFRTLAGMNSALASGACDVIGLARSLAVDPEFPQRLLNGEKTKSSVQHLSTGFKALDKLFPLEITWYTDQIHRMGRGLNPKPNQPVLFSVFKSLCTFGLQGLKRVRAK